MAALFKKKIVKWFLLPVFVLGTGFFIYSYSQSNNGSDNNLEPHVIVEQGTIVEKALAVGTIEPRHEIEIKSIFPGVIDQIFVEEGEYVRKGDPLIEVRPDPTPIERAEARRNLERIVIELDNLERDLNRAKNLKERNLISDRDYEELKRNFDDALVRKQLTQERLELLESGRIQIGDTQIESVIRSPIDGYILEKMVDVGDPIVPLTSYQAGTPLMAIAEMSNLLFKGTVDEIDVGKITEGLPVEIKIGALPGAIIHGEVTRISLKARDKDNATVFPIEIAITDPGDAILRAGYSANADIIINRRTDVLTIPERVVHFKDDRTIVELPGNEPGNRQELEVKLGLSDAITVEVLEGLAEGDTVLEPKPRSLTVR